MARYERKHVNKLSAKEFGFKLGGKPNQVARFATGIVDFDDVGVADETITIGDITYTFKADPTAVSSTETIVYVDIAGTAAAQATALVAAINASGASATTYASLANGSNIKPNAKVAASIGYVDAAGDAVIVYARKPGVGGNAIVFTEASTNVVNYQIDGSTVATTLTGGVDGNNLLDANNYTNLSLFNTKAELPQAELGGAAADTIDTSNTYLLKGVAFQSYNITAQTLSVPVSHAKGLTISGDLVDGEAIEINCGYGAESKHAYQPARDGSFFVRAKMLVNDVSGIDRLAVGFRKIGAGVADWNDYDELIALDMNGGDIFGDLIKNNAATDTDDLGDDWADAEVHEFMVVVGQDGNVKLYIDGAAPTTAHAGTLKFDANEIVIPFIGILQDAGPSAVYLQEFECGQIPKGIN